jgi:hypothetical protein
VGRVLSKRCVFLHVRILFSVVLLHHHHQHHHHHHHYHYRRRRHRVSSHRHHRQSAWREASLLSREVFLYSNCTPWNTSCLYSFAESVVTRERSLFPTPSNARLFAISSVEMRSRLLQATIEQDAEQLVGTCVYTCCYCQSLSVAACCYPCLSDSHSRCCSLANPQRRWSSMPTA